MTTTTGIEAIVKRIKSGKIYKVSNLVDATFIGKGKCHYGDLFQGTILKDGKRFGRVFSMYCNEFEIVELISEENLPYLKPGY